MSDEPIAASDATSTLRGSRNNNNHALEGFKEFCGKCGAKRIDNQPGLEPTVGGRLKTGQWWSIQNQPLNCLVKRVRVVLARRVFVLG
jgi:hypothetical protein